MSRLQDAFTRPNPSIDEVARFRVLTNYLEANPQLQAGQDLSEGGFSACLITEIIRTNGGLVEYHIADRYAGKRARIILNFSLPQGSRMERWDVWDVGMFPPPAVSLANQDARFEYVKAEPVEDKHQKEVAQACSLAVMAMDFLEDRDV